MKKNNIIIAILLLLLIISCIIIGWFISFEEKNIVNETSSDNELEIICDSPTISLKDELSCSIKGNVTEYEVSAVSSIIEANSQFNLVSVTVDSIWEGEGDNGDIDLYTDVNKKNKFNIVSFNISLINDDIDKININLIENSFFDENYEEHKLKNITKTITVKK